MIIWFDGTPRPSPDHGLTSDCIEAVVETIAEKPQDGTVPIAQHLDTWRLVLSLQRSIESTDRLNRQLFAMLRSATIRLMDGAGPKDGQA